MRYRPGQTLDHYEILEGLGEGAYAETYKARDTASGRVVLLKLPNPQMMGDVQTFARFKRETEIAERLDDVNVQRSLELRTDVSEPYIVLEYVEGENLRRKLQKCAGEIPVDTALDWGLQLAHALKALHDRGITHRDLKPENIVVTDEGVLKIVDFGSALLAGARRLTWRHLTEGVGTPDYMSPEQIQGERGGPRSDVYAWGVIMYELLTCRVPFEGDNWLAVMAGHLQRTPARIRDIRPDVPPALEAVVLTAMRRFPEHRYQSADELLGDLEHLDHLDVSKFDLAPERPMGGMSSIETAKGLWIRVALIAGGFFAVLILVVVLAEVLR